MLDFETLVVIETAIARRPTTFPSVPGLLSFREVPAVLEAMLKWKTVPDLLLCDGQGLAHPRRLGIAVHLGLLVDIPAIGVGKSRLTGTHEDVPMEKGEQIEAVLRTRTNTKPLYISPGHRVGLDAAHRLVMKCVTRPTPGNHPPCAHACKRLIL